MYSISFQSNRNDKNSPFIKKIFQQYVNKSSRTPYKEDLFILFCQSNTWRKNRLTKLAKLCLERAFRQAFVITCTSSCVVFSYIFICFAWSQHHQHLHLIGCLSGYERCEGVSVLGGRDRDRVWNDFRSFLFCESCDRDHRDLNLELRIGVEVLTFDDHDIVRMMIFDR